MSASVTITVPPCKCCGDLPLQFSYADANINITYNLSRMLNEAGFVGWEELVKMSARKAGKHILKVLDEMSLDPEKYRAMNPKNGWGDYDSCLQDRLRKWATICVHSPKGSRLLGTL